MAGWYAPAMLIGLIGSGHIGGTLAMLMVDAGYSVVLSNSRGPETLTGLVSELGSNARAATARGAAEAGDVVVVTIPFGRYRQVPAEPLADKIVIDTNNYYPQRDGRFPELDSGATTSSQMLAAHLPGSSVVKAFNTINFRDLATRGRRPDDPGRIAVPIAGDDEGAKKTVAGLIDSLGFDVVDVGPLREGRRFQPDTPPYARCLNATELRQALEEN
jgi:predicted dinucleotide-binding enzyme